MGKIAFVFPGQGAQAVGMGKDVYDALPQSRAVFDKGDEVLGFSLSRLVFEGPDSELKQTVNTQPALVTASVAYLEALGVKGLKPDYVAGHSLGEYSALVAAGVLSYEDAVQLVRLRGRFMEEAVPGGQGQWLLYSAQNVRRLPGCAAALPLKVILLSWPMLTARDRLLYPVRRQVSVLWWNGLRKPAASGRFRLKSADRSTLQ